MAIVINENCNTFTIQTKNSTYQMKVDKYDVLLHTYYGEKTDNTDKSVLFYQADRGFSGNPYNVGKFDRTYSMDSLPQEYSCFGLGDYRITALRVENADGSQAADLHYTGYSIEKGKYCIEGLPAVYAKDTQAETLIIQLQDTCNGLEVLLYYGVIEELDIITRAVKIINKGKSEITLQKAASINIDWDYGDFDLISFYGRHGMEMNLQRAKIHHGIQSIGSVRGISSHQYNPFVMLCESGANEAMGSCYGFSFVYSGEFLIEVEKDQIDRTRLICGIHDNNFKWTLQNNDSLWLPEVIMTHSKNGMGGISRNLHNVIREHICRGGWKKKRRPILINSWEAAYFDFTGDMLVELAKESAKLGIELFVLDDGWFGKRDDDNTGLGDWVPNEKKLGCSLKKLSKRIMAQEIQFGIWIEPESISEDSDLYRKHPEWAVKIPNRKPCLSRNQLILDFSRKDVQDYIIETISNLIKEASISYIKWDFNRAICDKYSNLLKPEQQGEFSHRYILGLYRVLEKLTTDFPEVLFESCGGGGARFDVGMLYYTPQIWGSDNTDAIERLSIQYGASFGYPICAMGTHVSAVPNHQTGRITPLSTRACMAMSGTFGYELDIAELTEQQKQQIKKQITAFKEYSPIIQYGDYYRITSPMGKNCTVWEFVDKKGKEALVHAIYHHVESNPVPVRAKMYGLKDSAMYQLVLNPYFDEKCPEKSLPYGFRDGELISGATLRQVGFVIPNAVTDFQAWQIYIKEYIKCK